MFEWKTSGNIMFLLVCSVLSNLNFVPPYGISDIVTGKTLTHLWGTYTLINAPFTTFFLYALPSLILTFSMAPIAQSLTVFNILSFCLGLSIYILDKQTPFKVMKTVDEYIEDSDPGNACRIPGFMQIIDRFIRKYVYDNIFKILFLLFFTVKLITGFSSGLAMMETKVMFGFINLILVLWLAYKIIAKILGWDLGSLKSPWGDVEVDIDVSEKINSSGGDLNLNSVPSLPGASTLASNVSNIAANPAVENKPIPGLI
jgi:hypothetical protein